jgi:hypothetical protein
MDTPTKTCTKCGCVLTATTEHWHVAKHGLYGLAAECKQCKRKYLQERYQRDKAKVAASTQKWRDNNRDKVNKKRRENRAKDPEKRREQERKYVERNRERINERHRVSYRADPEKGRAKTAKWRSSHREQERAKNRLRARSEAHKAWIANYNQLNKHKRQAYTQGRIAKIRGGVSDFSHQNWSRALEYFDHRCAVCGKSADMWRTIAMDHWIPVSKDGSHTPLNIVPLCHAKRGVPYGEPSCNQNKHSKEASVWLTERYGSRKAKLILKRIETYFTWVREQDAKEGVA